MALPAVIFLDLNMPIIDGFTVLQWIRRHPALRAVRVFVLSSSEHPADLHRCTSLGAQGYLVKDPGSVVLGSVLRRTLEALGILAAMPTTKRE